MSLCQNSPCHTVDKIALNEDPPEGWVANTLTRYLLSDINRTGDRVRVEGLRPWCILKKCYLLALVLHFPCWILQGPGRQHSQEEDARHGHLKSEYSYQDLQHHRKELEHTHLFLLHSRNLMNRVVESMRFSAESSGHHVSFITNMHFLFWDEQACFSMTIMNFYLGEERGKIIV